MSPNPQPLIATIYNPQNQSKEDLIAGFIARKQKFERLFRDVRDAPMTKPEQHYLIQGVRGMGKTTFLLRIAYEIENTPDLRERLIPIVFNEEEYGIGSLADVWERTAQYVEESDKVGAFAGLLESITLQYGQPDYEQQALQTLVEALRQHDKKLLLLIDNIGDLLKKLDSREEKRLREVLLTTPELRLIGATSVVIEQAHDYSKPFYEFFKVIHLEGLARQEAVDLFLKLGETYHTEAIRQIVEQQPGRIESIRRLTGGVIRTMVLLFEILVENNSGSVFRDLNVLLDRVTPLYKHRIDDLPAQQQKIVAALAQAWDAASAKELAQVVRLESKVVSAQLKQLIDNSVVEKVETKTKNHLYRLEERFFNIWYLMRFGRKTDQRVLWLVRFFETMFEGNAEWMQKRIDGHLQAMEIGTLDPEAALYLTTAFAGILKDEEMEDLLKKKTRTYLVKSGFEKLAVNIEESKHEKITRLMLNYQYDEAILILKNYQQKSLKVYADLVSCQLLSPNIFQDVEANFIKICLSTPHLRYVIREDNDLSTMAIEKIEGVLGCTGLVIGIAFSGFQLDKSGENNTYIKFHERSLYIETASRYFFEYPLHRKEIATRLLLILNESISDKTETAEFSFLKGLINLWNNNLVNINDCDFSPRIDNIEENNQNIVHSLGQTYLKLLLAKKQYHTAYNYFQKEEWQLKDRFKPLYYATLHFLRDEYPTEYLRMGPELKETVDDILAEVAQMAIDYA